MCEKITIDYITISDIYRLQDLTGVQIFLGGNLDEERFSEAIRRLISSSSFCNKKLA